MEEFKSLVTEVLTKHASAILLDPEWGLPASKRRAPGSGLLLAYEKTGYDANTPGRLPDLLDDWSVRRLKEAGADCLKILLYYTPFDSKNDQRPQARVGRAHRRRVPRQRHPVLPRVRRLRRGRRREGARVREEEAGHRHRRMKEFTKDRYGVDVMKVEVPVNMKFVEGAKVSGGQSAYSKKEAMDHFRRAADVSTKPFIYLSAGVSNPEFTEALELAAEAGTQFSGVLCGRATWKDGIAVYGKQGGAAFRKWLEDEGVKNISNVNERLKAAHPGYQVLRREIGRRFAVIRRPA